MSSDRPNQTLADYVALAVSPALLMGLVTSLVFFLLEVLYSAQGEYKDRLQWILFFFVFGAVLVGRISMTQGIAGRAGLYGLVLAGLTWAGMQIYVEYPKDNLTASLSGLINLVLVGVVWWCSHRLTWDCTQIDEETEVGGEGLLRATGLEKQGGDAAKEQPAAEKVERTTGGFVGWWERWERYREARKKRPRVLGAWVIYFSLAALPLFGLGEALIPAEDAGRRQYAFWLMAAYVGSGLGLLLTTCFLSLRRYLRQRRLQMPAAMTVVWLTAGAGLIVVLLLIGALLPRPRPEYALLPFQGLGSEQLSASHFAGQGGGSGKGEGRRIGDQPKGRDDSSAGAKDAATGRDKGSPTQDKDKGGSAGDKDKDGSGKGADKDASQKDKNDDSGRDKNGDSPKETRDQPPPNPKQQPPSNGDKTAAQPQQPSSSAESPKASSWDWASTLATVGMVLKWIVFVLLILAVVFFVLREGLKFLANFTDWARNLLNAFRNLWASLFAARPKEETEDGEDAEAAERAAPPRPFASYVNPFLDGRWERRPIKELVTYTFAALQAWARERNLERRPGETPLEFAARLGEEVPALEADVRRFTVLYARAVYDFSPLPANAPDVVRQFWKRLETALEQPLSLG